MVWQELVRQLETGRESNPQWRRLAELRGEREHLEQARGRLVRTYQEELITLDELRSRMPAMHSRKRVLETEPDAIENAAEERERYLRIVETLEAFRDRLRTSAETLDVIEGQKVLRSLVTEVLAGNGEITIRHPIPMTEGNGCSSGRPTSNSLRQSPRPQSYLLRWGASARTFILRATTSHLQAHRVAGVPRPTPPHRHPHHADALVLNQLSGVLVRADQPTVHPARQLHQHERSSPVHPRVHAPVQQGRKSFRMGPVRSVDPR